MTRKNVFIFSFLTLAAFQNASASDDAIALKPGLYNGTYETSLGLNATCNLELGKEQAWDGRMIYTYRVSPVWWVPFQDWKRWKGHEIAAPDGRVKINRVIEAEPSFFEHSFSDGKVNLRFEMGEDGKIFSMSADDHVCDGMTLRANF